MKRKKRDTKRRNTTNDMKHDMKNDMTVVVSKHIVSYVRDSNG